MCTSIVEIIPTAGCGKGERSWFDVTRAVVTYDHPRHALLEEAISIDFLNPALGASARVAVEITLDAAKELRAALSRAIAAADAAEAERLRGT